MNKLLPILCVVLSLVMAGSEDIINGQQVENEINFIVSIYCETDLLGAGVIIDANWVVTVAHLFYDLSKREMLQITVGHGSNNLGQQMHMKVATIHRHNFNISVRLGDIALLKVPGIGQQVGLGEKIKIKIGEFNHQANQQYSLVGWGVTNMTSENFARSLQGTTLKSIIFSDCRRMMLTKKRKQAGLKMDGQSTFCLVGNNVHACYGDSGSPAFRAANNDTTNNDNNPQTWWLYGLVSYGSETCDPHNMPIVFTKLHHYLPFINQIIGKH